MPGSCLEHPPELAPSHVSLKAPAFHCTVGFYFLGFTLHTCSGDGCWRGRAQVADLKEEPHCGVQRDPLVACQRQHLETTERDTSGGKEDAWPAGGDLAFS